MNAVVKYGLLTFLVAAIALLLGVLAGRFAATASTGFAGNLRAMRCIEKSSISRSPTSTSSPPPVWSPV